MNSLRMAWSYFLQAEERLRYIKASFKRGNYAYVVRESQEAVELSLKAALRAVGIEPAKIHDVGPLLVRHSNFFPEWFRENIEKMAAISETLAKEREKSMYGDEETLIPPNMLYTEENARSAMVNCEFVLKNCRKLLESLPEENKG
ncbi:MAG: HEPN domain-containing protein [Candidatus Korarchaeota archaeon]